MSLDRRWTVQDSAELYHIPAWGSPYFGVNDKGNITVRPRADGGEIDLKDLVDDVCKRGIGAPILLRFNDILESRVADLTNAFNTSIREYGYKGTYRGVMPIKVNQQRHVVEELVRAGRKYNLGLEAGSKAELLIGMALLDPPFDGGGEGLLVCNGYKDSEYVETALHAQRLGLTPILVLDRFAELDLVMSLSKKFGVRPHIGVRARLTSKGAGKWQESSGDRSKFGLSASEICRAVEVLKANGMLECLELLHFHIGSQITSIRSVKDAIREATRVYQDLRRMGAENLQYMDVGGGLAVDYDGSKTNFHSSRNYSNQEYANDIVSAIQDACDKDKMPHPAIVTEAGRALVAHHAVLVFNVLGTNEMANPKVQEDLKPVPEEHQTVQAMWEAYQGVTNKNFQESYNDASTVKDEAETLFSAGVIDLKTRARVEDIFWAICERVARTTQELAYVPDDLAGLKKTLSDTFYCNFSVFQSLPDSWAVDQLFPIVPLHRLDQEPGREAIIADLTCDSDGKVDMFIDLRDVKPTLRLHAMNGQPYFLAAFLVGAYQETLGDLHNLFGDTNVVHVSLPEGAEGYQLEHVVEGDSVADVLSYVEYDKGELVRRVRQSAERAVRAGRLTFEQSASFMRRYEDGLAGYTYLEDID